MYIFSSKDNPEFDKKTELDERVEKRIQEIYGTTLVTRILAVIGLVFLLALLSVAIIRVASAFL